MDKAPVSPGSLSDRNPPEERHDQNEWIIGIALLFIGGVFLFQNFTGWQLERWWASLLFIPSIGSFATARQRYREVGHTQKNRVLRPIFVGLTLLVGVPILLLDLEWRVILPILMILVGVTAITGVLLRSKDSLED